MLVSRTQKFTLMSQTSMSATPPMDTVNTSVPTLRETLAAPVTLAMTWTAMGSTVQVDVDTLHDHFRGVTTNFTGRKQRPRKTRNYTH